MLALLLAWLVGCDCCGHTSRAMGQMEGYGLWVGFADWNPKNARQPTDRESVLHRRDRMGKQSRLCNSRLQHSCTYYSRPAQRALSTRASSHIIDRASSCPSRTERSDNFWQTLSDGEIGTVGLFRRPSSGPVPAVPRRATPMTERAGWSTGVKRASIARLDRWRTCPRTCTLMDKRCDTMLEPTWI